MSDDEADPELVALLRAHLLGQPAANAKPETGVLESAEYVYSNSIDVFLDMWPCKTAANAIYRQMQEKSYSTATWSEHPLHPQAKGESTVAFIFTMDLLNFSFWSKLSDDKRFAVEYKGKTYTGYWSLVASLQRALDEGWYLLHRLPTCLGKTNILLEVRNLTAEVLQIFPSRIPTFGRTRMSARWTPSDMSFGRRQMRKYPC